jgi:3-hydroxybutyryl-CoA dehydratase
MEFELGKSYDTLRIGEEASFTKTISETDVYLFAGISGDFNPMHVNEEFAKLTPFKTRIAHGALPQSLIAPVLGTKLPGLGTVAVQVTTRFKRPTFFGDTITATAEVVEKLERKRWVRLRLIWTNQRGELVSEGEAVVIPPPRREDLGKKQKQSKTHKEEEEKMAFTNVKEVFVKMPESFNANAAQGLNAVFQFDITGDDGGKWNVAVKDGACVVNEGANDAPTVTLTMDAATWLGMVNKEVNGMQAFMSGKLKATGDIMLAQRFASIFPV